MSATQTTGLEQMLCFDLYTASRAMTALYRPVLDPLGLTYPQYLAMCVIWHRETITVSDLGRALDLDSGTLSPLLKRLQHQGLIQRDRGTHDERTVWVTATAEGDDLRRRAADVPRQIACAVDLTLEEFGQLHTLLGRIRQS